MSKSSKNKTASTGDKNIKGDSRLKQGVILIVVLVVIVLLSLSSYTYCSLMITEQSAAQKLGKSIQAQQYVHSGAEWVRLLLAQKEQFTEPEFFWNNQDYFQAVLVHEGDTNDDIGMFTIIAPGMEEGTGIQKGFRYGLFDESNKLNVNILTLADSFQENGGRNLLMSLPLMDETKADCIMDWIDEDDEVREFGAEIEYYQGLSYAPKNGPPDSLEELLLVKGVTSVDMFGIDTNHNGIVDQSEAEQNTEGLEESMLLGWSSYLTLQSKESNVNTDGVPRVYINEVDMENLYTDLSSLLNDEISTFIVAYRMFGPYQGDPPDEDEEQDPVFIDDLLDLEMDGEVTVNQVLDFVDALVEVDFGGGNTVILESPINSLNLPQLLPQLMENVSSVSGSAITGRINLNQAPAVLLAGVPGMDEEILEQIITRRDLNIDPSDITDINRRYETWILTEKIVDLETMRIMLPFVCAGGDVYSAEVVGYFQEGNVSARANVVFDTTELIPRLLSWKDKSHLPFGYDKGTLGLAYTEGDE